MKYVTGSIEWKFLHESIHFFLHGLKVFSIAWFLEGFINEVDDLKNVFFF